MGLAGSEGGVGGIYSSITTFHCHCIRRNSDGRDGEQRGSKKTGRSIKGHSEAGARLGNIKHWVHWSEITILIAAGSKERQTEQRAVQRL